MIRSLLTAAGISVAVAAWVLGCIGILPLFDFGRARRVIAETLEEHQVLDDVPRCPACTAELIDIYCYLCYWNRAPVRKAPT